MTRWVEWCRKAQHRPGARQRIGGNDYGDWLAIGADTPKDLIGTAYFAYSTHLVARSYAAVGKTEEADRYERLFDDIKAAFNKRYVAPDGRIQGNTQCCYAMALKFELLPDALRAKAAQYLEEDIKAHGWHVTTGFVGVSYMLPVLTAGGQTRYGLPSADARHVSLLALLGQAGGHDHLGALGRLDARAGLPGPGHELVQPLFAGLLRAMAVHTVAGIGLDPPQPGYRHVDHPSAPGRRPYLGQGQLTARSAARSPRPGR